MVAFVLGAQHFRGSSAKKNKYEGHWVPAVEDRRVVALLQMSKTAWTRSTFAFANYVKYSQTHRRCHGPSTALICVVSMFSGKNEMFEVIRSNHMDYAAAHEYRYCSFDHHFQFREPSWSKLPMVESVRAQCEFIVWVDADAIFTNKSKGMEMFIPRQNMMLTLASRPRGDHNETTVHDDGFWSDVVVKHRGGLGPANFGVFIINARHREVTSWLQEMWNFTDHIFWENAAVNNWLKTKTAYARRICQFVWLDDLNAMPYTWRPGALMLHAPGRTFRKAEKYKSLSVIARDLPRLPTNLSQFMNSHKK